MARKGGMDKAKGKAKEMTGKITGNREQEVDGKVDQMRGEAKKTREKLQDRPRTGERSIPRDPH